MADIRLDPLLSQIRHRLDPGTYLAQTAQLSYYADTMTAELRAHVLAHQLPPQTIRQLVAGTTRDQRFATWADHFKATYRGRWWMRWRPVKINYIDVEVPYRHTAEVIVRDYWSFPEARIYPPELGSPVMITITDTGSLDERRR